MTFESFAKALVEEETKIKERKIMNADGYLFTNWGDHFFPLWACDFTFPW